MRRIERAQDDLVALGAEFHVAMVEAQRAAKLSPTVTHAAVEPFLAAQGHQAAARSSWIKGHTAMEKIARVFGIPFTMDDGDSSYGDSSKYPPVRPFVGAEDSKPRIAA